jgi:hypothetical protein
MISYILFQSLCHKKISIIEILISIKFHLEQVIIKKYYYSEYGISKLPFVKFIGATTWVELKFDQ